MNVLRTCDLFLPNEAPVAANTGNIRRNLDNCRPCRELEFGEGDVISMLSARLILETALNLRLDELARCVSCGSSNDSILYCPLSF